MFDIAFSELILIAIVALLVIGPEQMPKVARTAGRWFGKMRQFVRTVQADIEREIRAEDLKRIMDEQARSSGIYEVLETAKDAGTELKRAGQEIESLAETKPAPSAGGADAADANMIEHDKASPPASTESVTQPTDAGSSAQSDKNESRHG